MLYNERPFVKKLVNGTISMNARFITSMQLSTVAAHCRALHEKYVRDAGVCIKSKRRRYKKGNLDT